MAGADARYHEQGNMTDLAMVRRATLRELIDSSERYERISYAHADDDAIAWSRFAVAAQELGGAPAAAIGQTFWAARWRNQVFPRVVLGPRRAASLMSTGVATEQMEHVLPPWRAFLVEINDSPISIRTASGDRSPIDRIEVQYSTHLHGRPAWSMIAESAAGPSLHRFNELAELWIRELVYEGPADAFSSDCDDEDLRILLLLSRLVAGLCLSLSTPEQRDVAEQRGRSKSYKQRRRGPPMLRDYVLGDDVRIDVRHAVGEYVARGGRAPRVQSLVRGHWKMQVHGKERALRKWLHIEPYWRGPEDAPVVMRRHKIAEAEEQT